ncbi:bifunctional UDP-N-acetylglucosamine 2-epimerase/N-acetylmannosamine kinase-like [Saccoglossus kowalevskii]|uniref:Bifunctional UDP-N-acetylglucosamine 2-epimerase/N-acetylmannosamine kinase-like n=1 Tax=Saccoglossus kowalevskii TaxID=10224 RepID=A0ABM0GUA0_SACKO|nr:PREDICTED: bifunctional UDP-N-acetylglucosamine 2-epimerase/N-acetylmannosamine kinase-like [Saccoglossus kowalevskii]
MADHHSSFRPIKVCVATSNRADYSKLSPIMIGLRDDPDFELQVIVTGSHLLDDFGTTIKNIERDNIKINWKLHTIVRGEDEAAMVESVGLSLSKLPDILLYLQPDLLVVHGDRFDALALATAAALMNIRIVHVEGGEVSGTIDDSIRHAITKLSHYHLCCTEKARARLIAMCEDVDRILLSGCPVYDNLLKIDTLSTRDKVIKKWLGDEAKPKQYIISLQHPVTTEIEHSLKMFNFAMDALLEFGKKTLVLYPNVDAGSKDMTRIIREKKIEMGENFVTAKHIPFEEFIVLMANCGCLIGNSSCVVRETCAFGTPVVSLGSRQTGRESGENVFACPDADSKHTILQALELQYQKEYPRSFLYGDGNSVRRILDFMRGIDITERIQKTYTFPALTTKKSQHVDNVMEDGLCVVTVALEGAVTKMALVNNKGEIIHRLADNSIKWDRFESWKNSLKKAIAMATELDVNVIGLGVCLDTLKIDNYCNENKKVINGWSKCDFEKFVYSEFSLPTCIESEASCRTSAENHFGINRNRDTILNILINKDIEARLVCSEQNHISPVNIGHMTVHMNGPLCECGSRGCVNCYSSERALLAASAKNLQEENTTINGGERNEADSLRDLVLAAKTGNIVAQEILNSGADALICAMKNILAGRRISSIILHGYLATAYIQKTKDAMKKTFHGKVDVRMAEVTEPTLRGVAAIVMNSMKKIKSTDSKREHM